MAAFQASYRHAPKGARVSDVDRQATVQLSVVLKPGAPLQPAAHAGGPGLSRGTYRARHATKHETMERLRMFAEGHGLRVVAADAASHTVKLSGTYAQAIAAFQPDEIGIYDEPGMGHVVARTGHLVVPDELASEVVAVMGFDQRRVAEPHFRMRPATSGATSYAPADVASFYSFPTGLDGAGQTVGIIELGGGYQDAQVAAYFSSNRVSRTGTLVAVPVDGAQNAPDGKPDGADGEVQLDIEVVGSVAPAANIAVYFGPNQGSGFQDAITAAVNDAANDPAIISISWGGPESSYSQQDRDAMEQVLAQAATLGITVCVASGDNGASDGATGLNVDYPASSVSVLGCGGTSRPQSGPEVAWNDGSKGGASGGGYSSHFARPAWQSGVTNAKRGVPDVSGNADPQTGFQVSVDGTPTVIGGTSAVAPLYAGLLALINQSLGQRAGFVNPTLYQNAAAFTDIRSGSNDGYDAGPGWDPVTGLGSPIGSKILAALQSSRVT